MLGGVALIRKKVQCLGYILPSYLRCCNFHRQQTPGSTIAMRSLATMIFPILAHSRRDAEANLRNSPFHSSAPTNWSLCFRFPIRYDQFHWPVDPIAAYLPICYEKAAINLYVLCGQVISSKSAETTGPCRLLRLNKWPFACFSSRFCGIFHSMHSKERQYNEINQVAKLMAQTYRVLTADLLRTVYTMLHYSREVHMVGQERMSAHSTCFSSTGGT